MKVERDPNLEQLGNLLFYSNLITDLKTNTTYVMGLYDHHVSLLKQYDVYKPLEILPTIILKKMVHSCNPDDIIVIFVSDTIKTFIETSKGVKKKTYYSFQDFVKDNS